MELWKKTDKPARNLKRKFDAIDDGGLNDSSCGDRHRDLQSWNRRKIECCLSCGSFHTIASKLHVALKFSDEIRLLKLLPGKLGSDLVGVLVHARLKDDPEFEAVSYTWADESGNADATVNFFIQSTEKILKITRNCAAALRRFRDPDKERLLWIDSICIDQQNLLERSEQVDLMTSIYSQAQRVLVFVGDLTIEADHYTRLFTFLSFGGTIWDIFLRSDLTSLRQPLERFFSYPWFHRIWIIQEVIMAESVLIFFGTFVLNWKTITREDTTGSDDSKTWNAHYEALRHIQPSLASQLPPVLRLSNRIKFTGASLVDLLSTTRTCLASDPRDKVFALLGLMTVQHTAPSLRPDYTKSKEEIFAEATVFCIQVTEDLDILSHIQSPLQTDASWVPDFSDPVSPTELRDQFRTTLRCSEKVPEQQYIFPELKSLDSKHLTVEGFILDSIVHVQNDPKMIVNAWAHNMRSTDGDFLSLFQKLINLPPTQIPAALSHCPSQHRSVNLPFIEPSMGVDHGDLTPIDLFAQFFPHEREMEAKGVDYLNMGSIDLLAPKFEYEQEIEIMGTYRPYCVATLSHLLNLIIPHCGNLGIFFGNAHAGIGPLSMKPDDRICDLGRSGSTLILRQWKNGYRVVGPCFLVDSKKYLGCPARGFHRREVCQCEKCKFYWSIDRPATKQLIFLH